MVKLPREEPRGCSRGPLLTLFLSLSNFIETKLCQKALIVSRKRRMVNDVRFLNRD